MDWANAIGTATQALSLAKALGDIDRSVNEAETKSKLAELHVALAELRVALSDAKEELHAKDLEIKELKARNSANRELVEFNGYKYQKGENGRPVGSPFCPKCLADDGVQIRPENIMRDKWLCPRCNGHFAKLLNIPLPS